MFTYIYLVVLVLILQYPSTLSICPAFLTFNLKNCLTGLLFVHYYDKVDKRDKPWFVKIFNDLFIASIIKTFAETIFFLAISVLSIGVLYCHCD